MLLLHKFKQIWLDFIGDTVRYKDLLDDAYADLSDTLKSKGDVCAIVYCLERSMCDDLSAHLSQRGISCAGNIIHIFYAFPKWFTGTIGTHKF